MPGLPSKLCLGLTEPAVTFCRDRPIVSAMDNTDTVTKPVEIILNIGNVQFNG